MVLQTPKLPKPRSCAEELQMGCGFARLMLVGIGYMTLPQSIAKSY